VNVTFEFVMRPGRRQLVEAAVDAYLAWRAQCQVVTDAYGRWADARQPDAELAWVVYEDALDCEEQASALYAGLIERLGGLSACDLELPIARRAEGRSDDLRYATAARCHAWQP
jgi:hypothetical protein